MKRYWILTFGFLVGCGGTGSDSPGQISFSENKGEVGYIQLSVSNSKNQSLSKLAQIKEYKIIVDGDSLQPVEKTVSSEANGVSIDGLSIGKNRRIQVLALNSQGKVLREGVTQNIAVEGGKISQVAVALQSIPILLNLADGDHQSNQRLFFHVLTDPKHSVTIEEDQRLVDVVTSTDQVESNEKGEVKFFPGVLKAGAHQFSLRDLVTGKSSTLTLNLWDGAQIKAAPLFTASQVQKRLGQVLSRQSQAGIKNGEFSANIAEALWKTR